MKLSRILCLASALGGVSLFMLTGCGKKDDTPPPPTPAASAATNTATPAKEQTSMGKPPK